MFFGCCTLADCRKSLASRNSLTSEGLNTLVAMHLLCSLMKSYAGFSGTVLTWHCHIVVRSPTDGSLLFIGLPNTYGMSFADVWSGVRNERRLKFESNVFCIKIK